LGLLGITIKDKTFHEAAQDGVDIDIDLLQNNLKVGGKEFGFELSQMEKSLTYIGGVAPAFNKFGKQIFNALTSGSRGVRRGLKSTGKTGALAW
jgi:hypothetical protein